MNVTVKVRWVALLASLFLASQSRADILFDLPSATGEFGADGQYAALTSVDGPYFAPLAPAPGVEGIKLFGSAAITLIQTGLPDESQGVLRLDWTGGVSGVVVEPILYFAYDFVPTIQSSQPRFGTDYVFGFSFLFDDPTLGGYYEEFHVVRHTGVIDIDLGAFGAVGATVVGYQAFMEARVYNFVQGDAFSLEIPSNSLDLGVRGPLAVPEPSGLWMLTSAIPGAWLVVRSRRRRPERLAPAQ